MKRFVSLIAALSIAVAACGGAATTTSPSTASTATPVPATATPVPATATPTAAPTTVSVTWDGTTCEYRGPAVFPRGAQVLWVYTNIGPAVSDESLDGVLLVGAVKAGTTWEDVREAEKIPASHWPPPMADLSRTYNTVPPPAGSWNMQMVGDRYYVGCGTNPDSTDRYTTADLVYVIDR